MKNRKAVVLAILFPWAASAGDYSSWAHYKFLGLSTTAAGLFNPGTAAVNFPLLVRLTAANAADVFAGAASDGADVRFTLGVGTTDLPHEIERWDKAGQNASIWVLLPVVTGNSDAGATFKMYWGKSGQTTTSNGAGVFDTANGFLAVFHLNEAAGDTARDATFNRFKGVPVSAGAGGPPQDTVGPAGNAKKFWAGGSVSDGGSYRLVTSGGDGTATGKLSFISDVNTYTFSAWANPDFVPSSNSERCGIIAKSTGTTYSNYHIRVLETQPGNVQFSDGNGSSGSPSASVGSALMVGSWQHVAAVRSGPPGTASNSRIYLDGIGYDGTAPSNVSTENAYDVYIGSFSNMTGFFSGKLDEVVISRTARGEDWNLLSYQTQKPGSTALVVGPSDAPLPIRAGVRASRRGDLAVSASGAGILFRFAPVGSGGARLSLLDLRGREAWSRRVEPGESRLLWDGKAGGGRLPGGIYAIRLMRTTGDGMPIVFKAVLPSP